MDNTKPNVGLLIIDPQNDFSESRDYQGTLYVPGAVEDFERASFFIEKNKTFIKNIYCSMDVHFPMQIFHNLWWKNRKGEHPESFQKITHKDVLDGNWIPQADKEHSLFYLKNLEKQEGFEHIIWPNHCIFGHKGQEIQVDIKNAIESWQNSYGSDISPSILKKGYHPSYEFFGIFQSQVFVESDSYTHFNYSFAKQLNENDIVYAFGQAKSHCFGLSIKQLLDKANEGAYESGFIKELLRKIVVLNDCTSDIPSYEGVLDFVLEEASEKYGMRICNSTDVDVLNDLNNV